MNIEELKLKTREKFDKFCDTEGCERNWVKCDQKDSYENWICADCQKWGGSSGIPKYHKRPVATAEKILNFLDQTIEEVAKLKDEEFREKLEEIHIELHNGRMETAYDKVNKLLTTND